MLILETWIALLIMFGIFLFGGIGIIGWIIEGMRLDGYKEIIKEQQHHIRKLEQRLAHKNAVENIRVANEYYEESKNRE